MLPGQIDGGDGGDTGVGVGNKVEVMAGLEEEQGGEDGGGGIAGVDVAGRRE